MADLPISLTCADYARVMPLAAGMIDTPGIKLTMILGRAGKWTDRAEMLRRATQDATVAGGEGSMAQHLYRIDKGDRSHVGLPIFPLRNLSGRDIYVKAGSPLKSLKDLAGKRVGTYSVTASGSTLTVNFALTFTPGFSGAKNLYLYASRPGTAIRWPSRGTWTVP